MIRLAWNRWEWRRYHLTCNAGKTQRVRDGECYGEEQGAVCLVLLLVEGSAGFLELGDRGAELGELFEVGGDLGGGEEGADAEEDDR